jgi:hypothetical protein
LKVDGSLPRFIFKKFKYLMNKKITKYIGYNLHMHVIFDDKSIGCKLS